MKNVTRCLFLMALLLGSTPSFGELDRSELEGMQPVEFLQSVAEEVVQAEDIATQAAYTTGKFQAWAQQSPEFREALEAALVLLQDRAVRSQFDRDSRMALEVIGYTYWGTHPEYGSNLAIQLRADTHAYGLGDFVKNSMIGSLASYVHGKALDLHPDLKQDVTKDNTISARLANRNPDKYAGRAGVWSGEVIQVLEDDQDTYIVTRIKGTKDSPLYVIVRFSGSAPEEIVREGEYIVAIGRVSGGYHWRNVFGVEFYSPVLEGTFIRRDSKLGVYIVSEVS